MGTDDRNTRLGRLVEAATELAAGNYDVEFGLADDDDPIGVLQTALSMLADDLRSQEHDRGRLREREELLAAVKRSETRLRAVLDQLPAAVWTTDLELRMRSARGGPLAAFDAVEELAGLPLHGVLGVAPQSELLVVHQRALGGDVGTLDLAREERTWEVHISPVLGPDGASIDGTVAVALDVTETRAEQSRMQHMQKLESLGILAGGIAHDFNNLLVGMLGNSSLALMELPPDSPARLAVSRIEKAAARGSDLTRQLLAYSGKGRFVVEALDLGRVVQEMTELLQVSLSAMAVMRLDLDQGAPPVRADASQVRQVVMNLITNASDAVADRSGTITVRVGAMHLDRRYLDTLELADDLQPGLFTFIEVSDTGVGMSPEVVQRMFDPFFSTKLAGHGLGMAAVLGIVRGHSGGLKVYSEQGKGTTVKVLFPAEMGAEATISAELPPDRPPVPGQGLCVLVADDQETVRDVARAVLERAGYRTLLAVDGQEAIETFDAYCGVIDVAVIDLTMPRASGEEVFRHIRSVRPGLPVLLTSGYNEQDATSSFVGKGLAGFLQKPWRAWALLDKLEEVVGG
ncbi:MAG: response regulator [Proteobacteria bacterium]|nr:response regulator [Pseudomonadota bacterium]